MNNLSKDPIICNFDMFGALNLVLIRFKGNCIERKVRKTRAQRAPIKDKEKKRKLEETNYMNDKIKSIARSTEIKKRWFVAYAWQTVPNSGTNASIGASSVFMLCWAVA